MFGEEEKANIIELLSGMAQDDLLSLASTITKGLLRPSTREEANEAVLQHSDTLESILSRKKVSRDLLFNYLHWKKVTTDNNLDKKSLVNLLLNFWKQPRQECNAESNIVNNKNLITGQLALSHNDIAPSQVDLLAHQFTEWFYQMLNKDFLEGGNFAVGAENFWIDATLCIQMNSNGLTVSEEAEGSTAVIALLDETKKRHKLYFSPNLCPEGVRGRSEPHGMVSVLVCGTLHQSAGVVVGIFEQVFYLIKDPLTNNTWKIKRLQTVLTSKTNISALPTLSQGELTRPMLPIQNPD